MNKKEVAQIKEIVNDEVPKVAQALAIALVERFDKIDKAISALNDNKNRHR